MPDSPSPVHDPKEPNKQIDPPDTEPAQEWGERLDTGKRIERAGADNGKKDAPGTGDQK